MGTGRNYFIKNMTRLSVVLLFILTGLLIPSVSKAGIVLSGPEGDKVAALGTDMIMQNQPVRVRPIRLDILAPSLGVKFYRDGIVFLSHSGKEGQMLRNHVNFGGVDAYYANLTDSVIGDHMVFSISETFKLPCEAMTFTDDFSVMYYTRRADKKSPEKIYMAKYQAGKAGKGIWITDSKPLNICNDRSTYTHPALNQSGEFMIFASNRKGSAGGLDLFLSKVEGLGWSQPESLGGIINTKGNESFPFLDTKNNLYFSSDGHKGFGGYDIYFSRYNGKGWDKPVNLTQLLNSTDDDLAFSISRKDGKSALYTTRQKSGKNPVRLFNVTLNEDYTVSGINDLTDIFVNLAQPEPALAERPAIVTPASATDAVKKEPMREQIKTTEAATKPAVPAEKKSATAQTQPTKPVEARTVPAAKTADILPPASKDIVIYRIQFLSSAKPRASFEITVAGNKYPTYEYSYNGLNRYCAGEFVTLEQARNLLKTFKQEGYTDAFVVAFKNGVRSLDQALFK